MRSGASRAAEPVQEATADLLWAACRPAPDQERVESALRAGADLAWASEAAVIQRVSGLLGRVLDPQLAGADGEWAAELRSDATRCRAQALLVLPRLGGLLFGPLADAGVAVLVFKGVALVDRYPAAGLRPMDDVDLVVDPQRRPRAAVEVLTAQGWQVLTGSGRHSETILQHPELPGLPVELHEELAARPERSCRMTAADLWAARRPIEVAGAPALGLDAEFELVALAAHAAKPFHTFDRLIWSVDIAVAIEAAAATGTPLDWDRVEAIADRAAARSALSAALTHAAFLGACSPDRLRQGPARRTRRAALDPLLHHDWPVLARDLGMRHRLAFALIDDPGIRMRRALSDVASGGALRFPVRAYNLGWRFCRRWWSLRRGDRTAAGKGTDVDYRSSGGTVGPSPSGSNRVTS